MNFLFESFVLLGSLICWILVVLVGLFTNDRIIRVLCCIVATGFIVGVVYNAYNSYDRNAAMESCSKKGGQLITDRYSNHVCIKAEFIEAI